MASPKNEIFFIYSISTGNPLTGQAGSMSFDVYKDTDGVNLSTPTITEIGTSGAYQFTPVFSNPNKGIVYILNTGSGANPQRVARFMRPEDYNTDLITNINDIVADLQEYLEGSWEIKTTGPDAYRMIFYAPDGMTVLEKYDLTDSTGAPTATNVFKRTKV